MITNSMPQIHLLKTREEYEALEKAAKADNHPTVFPTHYVTKCGEIIGYFSICNLVCTEFWLHTIKASPRDSVFCINFAENLVRMTGRDTAIITVGDTSNYHPVIEKHFGYTQLYKTNILMKKL